MPTSPEDGPVLQYEAGEDDTVIETLTVDGVNGTLTDLIHLRARYLYNGGFVRRVIA